MRRLLPLLLLPLLLLCGCYVGAGGYITKPARFLRGDYEPNQNYVCASMLSVGNLDARDRADRYQFQCIPYQEFLKDTFIATKGQSRNGGNE